MSDDSTYEAGQQINHPSLVGTWVVTHDQPLPHRHINVTQGANTAQVLANDAVEQEITNKPNKLSSRFNNLNELEQPKCGVWSPLLGPCIRDWPHTHEEVNDGTDNETHTTTSSLDES